jgi:hypothetical protein
MHILYKDKCPCCKWSLEEAGGCAGCDRCIDCCKLGQQQHTLLPSIKEKHGEGVMYATIDNHLHLYGPDEKKEAEKSMCVDFGGHFLEEDSPKCGACGTLLKEA